MTATKSVVSLGDDTLSIGRGREVAASWYSLVPRPSHPQRLSLAHCGQKNAIIIERGSTGPVDLATAARMFAVWQPKSQQTHSQNLAWKGRGGTTVKMFCTLCG